MVCPSVGSVNNRGLTISYHLHQYEVFHASLQQVRCIRDVKLNVPESGVDPDEAPFWPCQNSGKYLNTRKKPFAFLRLKPQFRILTCAKGARAIISCCTLEINPVHTSDTEV